MNKKMSCVLISLLLFVPTVFAAEVEEITEPLDKIYDLVSYSNSISFPFFSFIFSFQISLLFL
ncbi:hypothetical protein KKG83_06480 [Candidatus Micrarchaeota archaeon]|nr:hypothetical protein [Candidatus Micrarchaeota archaeon]